MSSRFRDRLMAALVEMCPGDTVRVDAVLNMVDAEIEDEQSQIDEIMKKAVEACQPHVDQIKVIKIATWRKRFLGRGNAPKHAREAKVWLKEAARRACLDRGHLIENEHAAEAMGILDYGLYCQSVAYRRRTDGIVARAQFAAHRAEVTA